MASEKKLDSYSSEYVRSSPVTGPEGNGVIVGDINSEYRSQYGNVIDGLFKASINLKKLNDDNIEDAETLRVTHELKMARDEFSETWDNPMEENLNSEEWADDRLNALSMLRDRELEIIGGARLKDKSVKKFNYNVDEYHKQNEVNFGFKLAEHNKKKIIEDMTKNISYNTLLALDGRNQAEVDLLYDGINTAKSSLVRHGMNPTKVDELILDAQQKAFKSRINSLITDEFKGANIGNLNAKIAKSRALVDHYKNASLTALSVIDGFKESKAGQLEDIIFRENIAEVETYIEGKASRIVEAHRNEVERAARRAESERQARERATDRAERKSREKIEDFDKVMNKYEAYRKADNKNMAEGSVTDNIFHRANIVDNYDVEDIAYSPEHALLTQNYVYGKDAPISLVEVGDDNAKTYGRFIPGDIIDGMKEGFKEAHSTGGAQGQLEYVKQKAQELVGNPKNYQVSDEVREKAVKGATIEIGARLGIDPQVFKEPNVRSGKITTEDNIRAVNTLTNMQKLSQDADLGKYHDVLDSVKTNPRPNKNTKKIASAVDKVTIMFENLGTPPALAKAMAKNYVIGKVAESSKNGGVDFYKYNENVEGKQLINNIASKITTSSDLNNDDEIMRDVKGIWNLRVNPDRLTEQKMQKSHNPYEDKLKQIGGQ